MNKISILFTLLTVQFNSFSQDLASINVGTTLPEYQYNSSQNELTVQLTIRNLGFFNANAFDCALFLVSNINSSISYEVSRVNYSGLPYPSGNTLPITGWLVELSNFSIPSGTYRLEARINDNQAAYESNYSNNIEYFGQETFQYTASSSANLNEEEESSIQLFPNPVLNILNLKASSPISSISVFNLEGVNVGNQKLVNNSLDLSFLKNGYYFIVINYENNKFITKGIIKK